VLVVDDEPDIRHLVEFRLRTEGHQVLTAGSGAEALALVDARGGPDVAILDVTMPGMSGLELLPVLRRRDGLASMPAIFLSAKVQQHDIDAGRALDATHLTKPFVGPVLINAVARLSRGRLVSATPAVRGSAPALDQVAAGVSSSASRRQ
jgi:CheY-like chemotaxis protein